MTMKQMIIKTVRNTKDTKLVRIPSIIMSPAFLLIQFILTLKVLYGKAILFQALEHVAACPERLNHKNILMSKVF